MLRPELATLFSYFDERRLDSIFTQSRWLCLHTGVQGRFALNGCGSSHRVLTSHLGALRRVSEATLVQLALASVQAPSSPPIFQLPTLDFSLWTK